MKKSSLLTLRWQPKAMLTAATISLLAMSQDAEAVLFWDVSQSGADVTVQTSGSLAIVGTSDASATGVEIVVLRSAEIYVDSNSSTYAAEGSGTAEILPFTIASSSGTGSGDLFGHYGDSLFWDVTLASNEATLLSPDSLMTFTDTTISDLFGTHLDAGPLLAWTHNTTADTISIRLVPEPSSTALLGLGGLALMLRRRR